MKHSGRLAFAFPLLALLALLCASLFGQSANTGTISGRVFDEATGRSLQGAIVRVAGSPVTDYTDADGTLDLEGLAPGNYTIEIDDVGLDPQSQGASVTAGRTATLSVALKSEVLKLDTLQVAESARGQALAINQQKTSSDIGEHRVGRNLRPDGRQQHRLRAPATAGHQRKRRPGRGGHRLQYQSLVRLRV